MSYCTRIALRPGLVASGLMIWPAAAAQAQVLLDRLLTPDISGLRNEPGVTVTSRSRPDYDYRGVRVGSLLVQPVLTEAIGYDDNVTGTARARGSSLRIPPRAAG